MSAVTPGIPAIPKVYLSTCIWRELDAPVTLSIVRFLQLPDIQVTWSIAQGDSLISRSRSEQATRFFMNPGLGDVLIFIDSDMYFKPEDARQMCMDVLRGYPIVGGFYVTKNQDSPRPALRLKPDTSIDIGRPGQDPIEIIYPSTGFVAIHRRVFVEMAKSLPLCRTGDKSEMYPFFYAFPFDHSKTNGETGIGWEYLSEDWGFAQMARDCGFKSYVQPSVTLGHLGLRAYWASDVNNDPLNTTYTVVTEGTPDRTDLVRDLADFWSQSQSDVVNIIQNGKALEQLVAEWTTAAPTTRVEVEEFYTTSQNTVLAQAVDNLTPTYWTHLRFAMEGVGHIVDFGAGIGSYAIYMAQKQHTSGMQITCVDLPGTHTELLRQRIKTHDLSSKIHTAETLDDVTESANYIVALHTLEYLHPDALIEFARGAFDLLVDGGSLVISVETTADMAVMRLCSHDLITSTLEQAGFKEGPIHWVKPISTETEV